MYVEKYITRKRKESQRENSKEGLGKRVRRGLMASTRKERTIEDSIRKKEKKIGRAHV